MASSQWECPGLFPLPVEGSNTVKWVFIISLGGDLPQDTHGVFYLIGMQMLIFVTGELPFPYKSAHVPMRPLRSKLSYNFVQGILMGPASPVNPDQPFQWTTGRISMLCKHGVTSVNVLRGEDG